MFALMPPPVSCGTAFLDQQRLLPATIEKHYIGSMLYAFNFAEETQRAEGGQPLKVVRTLANDLGQGSYVHEPTDIPSPHESVHEMWDKMSHIKAKFTAVYGVMSASTSNSSDTSLSIYDDSSDSNVVFDVIVDKRVLSTIEELSESSGSVQALVEDSNHLRGHSAPPPAGLSTDIVHLPSAEDLTILDVVAATNHLKTLLEASDLDATWLDYSVSSDTEEDDSTSSIEVIIGDAVKSNFPVGRFPNEKYFEKLPIRYTLPAAPLQPTKSFVVLSGRKCTPALRLGIDDLPALHSSNISKAADHLGDAAITHGPVPVEYRPTDLELLSAPSSPGFSARGTAKQTFVGDVEIVLDVAEAFSKVDSLTGNRELPDHFSKPHKCKSMSNIIRKAFHRKQIPESSDGFDLPAASSPPPSPQPLSTTSTAKLSRREIQTTGREPATSDQCSTSTNGSSVSL